MKHFLSLADLTPDEVHNLLDQARQLKTEFQKTGQNRPLLKNKSLALLFLKPSLRTRVSFEMGMVHLGGYAFYLSPAEVKMGERESAADIARVLSGYANGIMARVFNHGDVLELAEYATVPVINGLSDYNHPAQGLTDLLTILERRGRLEGIKMAYVGDSNNVTRSLLFGSMLTGIHFAIASPAGYTLGEEDFERATKLATHGASFEMFHDPQAAAADADVIYTDVWSSMGQESESAEREKIFPPYQVNENLLKHARPDSIVMHCLPAHRGQEISAAVADGPHAVIFQQAENRLHAQKAILAQLLGNN